METKTTPEVCRICGNNNCEDFISVFDGYECCVCRYDITEIVGSAMGCDPCRKSFYKMHKLAKYGVLFTERFFGRMKLMKFVDLDMGSLIEIDYTHNA
ncbi:MAG: hypothetical protein ACFFGZ_02435 [Candidatus Thorarchaeota archaeon]